jgi:hypothetical protein
VARHLYTLEAACDGPGAQRIAISVNTNIVDRKHTPSLLLIEIPVLFCVIVSPPKTFLFMLHFLKPTDFALALRPFH